MGIIAVMFKIFISCFLGCLFFFVRAKKQPWATSLCHSLIPHTYGELLLRFVTGYPHRLQGEFFCKRIQLAAHYIHPVVLSRWRAKTTCLGSKQAEKCN